MAETNEKTITAKQIENYVSNALKQQQKDFEKELNKRDKEIKTLRNELNKLILIDKQQKRTISSIKHDISRVRTDITSVANKIRLK